MSCLMSCESFMCDEMPATHKCNSGRFCERHARSCCKPINSEPEGDDMTHDEAIATLEKAKEYEAAALRDQNEAQDLRGRIDELLIQCDRMHSAKKVVEHANEELLAKAAIQANALDYLAGALFKAPSAKAAITKVVGDIDLGGLIEEAMDEVDWREKVSEQIYATDLVDESRVREIIMEALGDVDWSEVLSGSTISASVTVD